MELSDLAATDREMYQKIFLCAFLISLALLGARLSLMPLFDTPLWGTQIGYVLSGDERQFDILAAYGHPGGPIIEGGIILHSLLGLSFTASVSLFLMLAQSAAIACICVICYALSRSHLWWIVALITLSANRLYIYATPPSSLASIFFVLLIMYAWYIYEKHNEIGRKSLTVLALILGILLATRVDVGVVSAFACYAFLRSASSIDLKNALFTGCISFAVFIFFDPFMWFMPLQHVEDLITKVIYHYDYFTPASIGLIVLSSISAMSFIAITLGASSILARLKTLSVLPEKLYVVMIVMTTALYLIFETSSYQAPRYFLPILFFWETVLPLYIFALGQAVQTGRNITVNSSPAYICAFTLIAYQLGFTLSELWLNYLLQ